VGVVERVVAPYPVVARATAIIEMSGKGWILEAAEAWVSGARKCGAPGFHLGFVRHFAQRCIATFLLAVGVVLAALAQTSIQQSHIEGNVPPPTLFRTLLDRDVLEYFKTNGRPKADRVEVALLREGPTQTGIAYPKYYAWVKIYEGSDVRQSGAVRLAAIEKIRFEVTDFVSQRQIREDPSTIERIFPAALIRSIRQRAERAEP
jgi:hypothetical protein